MLLSFASFRLMQFAVRWYLFGRCTFRTFSYFGWRQDAVVNDREGATNIRSSQSLLVCLIPSIITLAVFFKLKRGSSCFDETSRIFMYFFSQFFWVNHCFFLSYFAEVASLNTACLACGTVRSVRLLFNKEVVRGKMCSSSSLSINDDRWLTVRLLNDPLKFPHILLWKFWVKQHCSRCGRGCVPEFFER